MIAETVYPIVMSLPKDEQFKILENLKKDLHDIKKPRKKKPLITNDQARNHLLKIFLK